MNNVVWLLVTALSWHNSLAVWEDWTEWSSCSVTCGTGYHVRSRACADGLSSDCTGTNHDTKHCTATPCPVNGGWGTWEAWHKCSVTCGSGYIYRKRHCDDPVPQHGGVNCSGSSTDLSGCVNSLCPVEGAWSEWSTFTACVPSCGHDAVKQRIRHCNNPPPMNGGGDCLGSDSEYVDCVYKDCLDGTWSSWSQWSECSASCGTSVRFRLRKCILSSNGGTCTGNSYESGLCSEQCPVDGGWGNWGSWSSCKISHRCGTGSRERHRLCANPAPAHGGKPCPGHNGEIEECTIPCAVNGHWSSWGNVGTCSETCGNGAQQQQRACDNPPPSHGGLACSGSRIRTVACKLAECRVNGHWSVWGPYGSCSVTCGTGHHTKTRECNNPAPSGGGHTCIGSSKHTATCHMSACTTSNVNCPSHTWIHNNHSCYYISSSTHDWAYSGNWCSHYHAKLVQIESSTEQTFLDNVIKQKFGTATPTFWLDGEDKQVEGHWVWHGLHKQVGPYTNWHHGEPNGSTNQNCMAMVADNNYEWHDKPCNSNFHYICEKQ